MTLRNITHNQNNHKVGNKETKVEIEELWKLRKQVHSGSGNHFCKLGLKWFIDHTIILQVPWEGKTGPKGKYRLISWSCLILHY